MALPFLRSETEENSTQSMAFLAIVAITIGLAIFNVCGAIVSTQPETSLQYIIVIGFALVVSGAEFLAAVALVRVMLAKFWWRRVAGTLIFLGLAWVCVQNGKRAAHLIFPEFSQSATLLEQQALIMKDEADKADEAQQRAVDATPALLESTQNDLAEAKRQQRLLQAQSPEKIAEMQQMLITNGYYFYQIDGRIGPETERAMRSMGEDLRNDIQRLEDIESRLMAGMVTTQSTEITQPENSGDEIALTAAGRQAILEDQARTARRAALWIEVMLWVVEGARSFGLWALVTTIDSKTEEERRRSAAAKKAWKTRREKEEKKDPDLVILPQVEDIGWWGERIEKALATVMPKRTRRGMSQTYFNGMDQNQLEYWLEKKLDEGFMINEKEKRALTRDHVDFILMRGEYAPENEQEGPTEEPEESADVDDNEPDNLPATA